MTETKKPQSLVGALAQIQATMPVVRKGETAEVPTKSGGKYSYTYADLADVARAVYPILGEVGLAFIAMPTFRDDGKYVLVGELAHDSGDSRTGEFMLPDRGTAQEVGSAISYGRRYLLGCLTGIVTGDQDDDGAAASKRPMREQQPKVEPKLDENLFNELMTALTEAQDIDQLNRAAEGVAKATLPTDAKAALRSAYSERQRDLRAAK